MRLLIVEDEVQLGSNLKKILELKGFAVDWVEDGEKALSRATLYHSDYDVIILDLSLPSMDGMALTRAIRAEKITTPIIILTGKGETQSKVDLLNAGADDYVVKPFSHEELIARIASVSRRPATVPVVVHTVGNITIDTATHKVYVEGNEVALTLKEYALLECFLRRPGEVFTREELSNHVWDFNSMTWSNVLDVHMKNLRKKLERTETSPRFETVRGVGYRFVA
ncbi:MAG TPA: response regulator transcription factor [Candidatus Paceibacterota bacterium]|nr:response regulator transcription factor [Candidatus Paceibacterota bacterium]